MRKKTVKILVVCNSCNSNIPLNANENISSINATYLLLYYLYQKCNNETSPYREAKLTELFYK